MEVKENQKSIKTYTRKPKNPLRQSFLPGLEYKPLQHGAANTAIAHTPAKKNRYQEDKIAHTLTWTNGKLTVRIDKCGKPLSDEAQRVLDFLGISLTVQDNSTMVRVPFADYAEFRGDLDKKARQRLRKKVEDALEILLNTHMTWVNEKKRDVLRANILGSYVKLNEAKQYIQVNFTPEYVFYTKNAYIMPLDTRLGKLPGRNPHLYKIGRKLNEHYWMPANKERGTHDRLSVASLLNAAPDIPTFEDVRDKYNHRFRELIITPLENCLEALDDAGIISEWTWWRADNTPLTDEELERADYDTLIACKVHFHYTNPKKELPT